MDTVASAAFSSWSFDPQVIVPIVLAAGIYIRGWFRLRRVLPSEFSDSQLASFLSGLALVFIAIESPLDTFSSLLLGVHMVQHLLLMMIAPPLILYGQPMLPMLRGLPRKFVREALGPFLRWPVLRGVGAALISPAFAWAAYNVSTVGWHLPALYELALSSPPWHRLEHACFFWTAILFWWPVIQPWPSRPQWNRWIVVPYLLLADIVNTAVAATFIFADKILYPSYASNAFGGINPRTDQSLAGGIMWVPGSVLYLLPAVIIAMRLVGGAPKRRTTSACCLAVSQTTASKSASFSNHDCHCGSMSESHRYGGRVWALCTVWMIFTVALCNCVMSSPICRDSLMMKVGSAGSPEAMTADSQARYSVPNPANWPVGFPSRNTVIASVEWCQS